MTGLPEPDLTDGPITSQVNQPTFEDYMSCKAPAGITVGLIDGMIAIARVLKQRDLTSPGVKEALADLQQDEDIKYLLGE
jgi:hypothetical protein